MSKETNTSTAVTLEGLKELLRHDSAVKVAGIDVDGVPRGKLMAKSKFLSLAKASFEKSSQLDEADRAMLSPAAGPTFGFCSVVFGWDIHDDFYSKELSVSNIENGYKDVLAVVDLQSFRRIPWERRMQPGEGGSQERGIPFFLVSFWDQDKDVSLHCCPRSLLKRIAERLDHTTCKMLGYPNPSSGSVEPAVKAMAGAEYEFFTYASPKDPELNATNNRGTMRYLLKGNHHSTLPHLSEGMNGYSLTDITRNQGWFNDIFYGCEAFGVPLEGWHEESGPGVFEAALKYDEITQMADKAALFKFAVKCISTPYSITPTFMAKPDASLPGNSGHMHISLQHSATGLTLFAPTLGNSPEAHNAFTKTDLCAPHPNHPQITKLCSQFLAGILHTLPYLTPLLAPTINSYKRLAGGAAFWAPSTVSWGFEHRAASVRVIAPPTCDPQSTRLEVRVGGADANPFLVLSAILGGGMYGIENQLELETEPLGAKTGSDDGAAKKTKASVSLPATLKEALALFTSPESPAIEILGKEFVEHFAGTREHEVAAWESAVTDWEFRRYLEMV